MRRHGDPEADDDEAQGGRGGIRFILDVELSRLGHLQLDGLVRGKN